MVKDTSETQRLSISVTTLPNINGAYVVLYTVSNRA